MKTRNLKKRMVCIGITGLLFSATPFLNSDFLTVAQAKQTDTVDNADKEEIPAKLNVKTKSIVTESTFTLKVYNLREGETVLFKSDDTDIAKIDKEGEISTFTKSGSVTISAIIKNKTKVLSTLECEVTVGPPAASIVISKSELKLEEGKRYPFLENLLFIKPNTSVEIPVFSSSNTDVAVISSTGKIAAKKAGVTIIRATLENGASTSCKLIVVKEED